MNTAPQLITVEGIEGAGKSTAIDTIAGWLIGQGHRVVTTREPGGTALGEELRSMLLTHRAEGMAPDTEVLLMFAARAEHVARVIQPALAAGQWVVCDRFVDASIAYQGGGRGLGAERVEALAQWALADFMPTLTLWLDVPVEEGLRRAAGRSAPDRFESEKTRFFEAVRSSYAQLAKAQGDRIVRIDAGVPLDEVTQAITTTLEARIARR